jgi:hypothetical protein
VISSTSGDLPNKDLALIGNMFLENCPNNRKLPHSKEKKGKEKKHENNIKKLCQNLMRTFPSKKIYFLKDILKEQSTIRIFHEYELRQLVETNAFFSYKMGNIIVRVWEHRFSKQLITTYETQRTFGATTMGN